MSASLAERHSVTENCRAQHRGGNFGRADRLGAGERLLARRRRGSEQIAVLDHRLSRAARAERRGRTRVTRREIADADGAYTHHLRRGIPDVAEALLAQVAARDGHRHARHDVAVATDVTGAVRRAAGRLVEIRADPRW